MFNIETDNYSNCISQFNRQRYKNNVIDKFKNRSVKFNRFTCKNSFYKNKNYHDLKGTCL